MQRDPETETDREWKWKWLMKPMHSIQRDPNLWHPRRSFTSAVTKSTLTFKFSNAFVADVCLMEPLMVRHMKYFAKWARLGTVNC